MITVNILAISGSLRARSSNTEVLRAAALLQAPDVRLTLSRSLATLPYFNPDLDGEGAVLPPAVAAFRAELRATDALLICSPEYAHGVPGALKNALDWLVSGPEMPYRPVALLNASPRSTHAHASLSETLRTMSVTLLEGATLDVPRGAPDAAAIAATPELAEPIRSVLLALAGEASAYRRRFKELVP